MAKAKIQGLLKDSIVGDARGETDTIKLWESYKDMAILWRALALLQIPATAMALIFAFTMWNSRSITLKVPAKPLPGIYAAQEIPDSEFVDAATEFVNLIGSYQPIVARRQFAKAQEVTVEPFLTKFKEQLMDFELSAIEKTNRTQLYFIDPSKTVINRRERSVEVVFEGDRMKIVAGQELPLVHTRFTVTLTTVPRHSLNPYGIVVSGFAPEDIVR